MSKYHIKDIIYIAISLAILIVSSQLSIPLFNIIPITLQTLTIIVLGLILPTSLALTTILLYI
ncbi:MAG: biotin transporter BioY, partial [Bacilli bacterium]